MSHFALARIFDSYYLFESHYCTPGQGHEKGGIESDVGYTRRNFLTPVPKVGSFAELNEYLQQQCRQDANRRMRGQGQTITELWEVEKAQLLPLPATEYPACSSRPVKANPYSQVVFEANRYSVPAEYVGRQLALRAYTFRVEILFLDKVIASHERCFEREKDVLDPLHYLGLLSQRPGAFEHTIPIRRWRKTWPPVYEKLLGVLRERWPEGRGLREFIAILKLHQEHPAQEVEHAIRACFKQGLPCLDGIRLHLRRKRVPGLLASSLDLAGRHQLQGIGEQSVGLAQYDRLLRIVPMSFREARRAMETNALLETHLRKLRMPTFLENYAKFASDAVQNNQDHVRYLLALAKVEVSQREQNQRARRIKAARFPVLKELASFDFSAIPSLDKARMLDLARGEYIARCEAILLVGNPGPGKTHLAIGLGLAACRQGHKVRFPGLSVKDRLDGCRSGE